MRKDPAVFRSMGVPGVLHSTQVCVPAPINVAEDSRQSANPKAERVMQSKGTIPFNRNRRHRLSMPLSYFFSIFLFWCHVFPALHSAV
jgi:hypothetical protein